MNEQQRPEEMIATLIQLNEALRSELNQLKTDYLTLAESTKVMMADRESLQRRVLELEAANKRLTDMLWGRRSERRSDAGLSPLLDFGDDAISLTEETGESSSPEVIMAKQAAQAAYDKAKLAELEARRKARKERQTKREEFPAHLERRVRVLDLSEEEKQGLRQIGVKITERLRFEKPSVYVEQTQRPEYVKPGDPESGVRSVPPPPSIVESCKYDFSVISAIIVMKFAFHMPTYREEDFFGQSGWRPSRSTSNDLINYGVDCVEPLFRQILHSVLKQRIVLGDATTLTVLLRSQLENEDQRALDARRADRTARQRALDAARNATSPGNGAATNGRQAGSATSYAWLYSGLDAPREVWLPEQDWEANERPPPHESPPDFSGPRWQYAPYNVFHWSLTQQNSVIDGHLADFKGIFVGDAAGVNARLAARSGNRMLHQSCNSHARRYFVKAQSNDPILAAEMYSLFRQLYAVEYRGALMTSAERLALRQRDAVPIWWRMTDWLERDDVKRVLPKSSLGEAIGYLRNQWSSLRLYLEDGELPFDNNHGERIIRHLTIGRRNWMFLGSADAAPGRMQLFSVISSAHRHCLSIQDYLEDVLLKLSQAAQHRPQDLAIGSPLLMSLLPDRWAATHPQHVHWGRLAERRMVAENKLYYRLQAGLAGNHPYGQPAI